MSFNNTAQCITLLVQRGLGRDRTAWLLPLGQGQQAWVSAYGSCGLRLICRILNIFYVPLSRSVFSVNVNDSMIIKDSSPGGKGIANVSAKR